MSDSSFSSAREDFRREYEELAQLTGELAHEIRNPLSTICLNLEILREELKEAQTPRDRRMEQRVAAIRGECQQLEQLLNDFLHFARGLELSPEPVELSALVREFIQFQQPRAAHQQVEISPHLASGLPAVQLDPMQIRGVLLNLTMNAMQAMPEGGTLEFQTFREGDHVVLVVIDSGQGIDARHLPRIFDPFFSTKPDGSGLGLPTVRKVIQAHGGSIRCESEPNRGTRFRIDFPIAPSPQENSLDESSTDSSALG